MDASIGRLANASKAPVLLMLNEVKVLGDLPNDPGTWATLRAVLQQHKHRVHAVITGSSQEALAAMTVATGAPMYQFAQMIDFLISGDEFLQQLAACFRSVHPSMSLALADLQRVFEHIGFEPGFLNDLVRSLSAQRQTHLNAALARFISCGRRVFGWDTLLHGLPLMDQAVLSALARGLAPLSKERLDQLGKVRNLHPTIAKVQVALD